MRNRSDVIEGRGGLRSAEEKTQAAPSHTTK